MSFNALLRTAATLAQSTLSKMAGAASATADNFTLNGTTYQGVVVEVSAQVPVSVTGYEIIRELRITATRDQFAAKPSAAPRLPVTALGASWYLTNVEEGAVHYTFTCKPA